MVMTRRPKGRDGLTAVLDFFGRVRPVILLVATLLAVASLVLPSLLDDDHTVTHINSLLLAGANAVFAFTLARRPAIVLALASAIWLMGTALTSDETLVAPLPVASLVVAVTLMVTLVRESISQREQAQLEVESSRWELESALARSHRQILHAEALSSAARAYLAASSTEHREHALAELVRAAGSDVVRVTRNESRGEAGLFGIVESNVSADGTSRWESREDISWVRFPNVMSLLAAGKPHTFSSPSEIGYPDRHAYETMGEIYGSGLDMPILVDGRWEGTIGIACHEPGRTWEDGEITLLRSVADMVAAAWSREHAMDRLGDAIDQRDRSLRLQAALTDCSRTLLESSSEDSVIEALSILRAAIGVTVSYLEASNDGPVGPERSTTQMVTAEGEGGSLRNEPWSVWPYAYGELSEGRPYIVDDIDQLPDRERSWYMVNDSFLRAELNFPVMHEGTLVAVVGIGHDAPRRWSASEMRMMGSVARMIGAYWQRDAVRQALEDVIRSKDRFIASVSHELRTPMAVVLGLSTELNTRRGDFSADEAAEFIDLIARQSREVTHIIEDLLVSARAAETDITVLPEAIRLDHEIQEVLADLPSEYTFKVRSVDVTEMTAMADPVRTRQILRNLIINSHRHGGDTVRIVGRPDGDMVSLSVCDDGPGIPQERTEEIFEAYATTGRRTGMTAAIGLGLTVSRQLARLMGGDVVYRMEGLSTFELTLPGVAGATADQTSSDLTTNTNTRS